jgi:hypothetical protein
MEQRCIAMANRYTGMWQVSLVGDFHTHDTYHTLVVMRVYSHTYGGLSNKGRRGGRGIVASLLRHHDVRFVHGIGHACSMMRQSLANTPYNTIEKASAMALLILRVGFACGRYAVILLRM